MRLVIDLQGAQSDSRNRGIGRYSRALALAMAAQAGPHEVFVLLNGAFRDAAEDLRDAFAPLLPPDRIRAWYGPGRQTAWQPADAGRRRAAERIRAAYLASLRPDLVLVTSTFEGYGDDAVTAVPPDVVPPPTVGICYDLIPLSRPDLYLRSQAQQDWYYPRLAQLGRYEALLCISQSSREEVLQGLPTPADRVFNIQAGVGSLFRPAQPGDEPQAKLLGRYGLRPGYVLCVGAVEDRKNLSGLIRAFARLSPEQRRRHPLVATCWNDAHQLPQLRRTVEQAGLTEAEVRILTEFVPDDDLPGLYRGSAVSVCPSLHEGFGLSVAEAMACGIPALCSDVSSLPEVMDHPAALFDPKDPAAIAARLDAVLASPALAQELGRYGLARATRFTWPRTAERSWAALTETAARLGQAEPARFARASTREAGRKPRLCAVAPLRGDVLPLRQVLQGLARWYDITILSDDPVPDDPALRACFPVQPTATMAAQAAERVLYLPGTDSTYALLCLRLLDAYPGIVVAGALPLSQLLQDAVAGEAAELLQSELTDLHGWHAAVAVQADPAALARYSLDALLDRHAVLRIGPALPDAVALHNAIEQAYATSPQAALDDCLAGLARDGQVLPDTVSPEAAAAVGATFRQPTPRLLLDVSTIAAFDAGTGIQRVVRETVRQLGSMPDLGAGLELVSADPSGLATARRFGQRLFGLPQIEVRPVSVWPGAGDVFVGLDLHIHDVGGLADTIRAVRARGGHASVVIYDLLPVQMPSCFPAPVQTMYPHWLRTISTHADGLVCISRAVADDLLAWLDANPPPRTRPLAVGWYHLGADFLPPAGPTAAHACLQAATERPTALMVGTLEPRKGHTDTLSAFDALWADGVDVGLTFAGRVGWLMEGLERRILAHPELGRRLHWVRDADDALVAALYLRSGALLMASEGEGFGLPLVEAARAGLPVICRDLPVFREICGESALYFIGGPAPIAASVRRWLSLRQAGQVPDPAGIRALTWAESSRRLADIVLRDEWYAHWTPKGPKGIEA